jgi:hypothetical protein
MMVKKIGKAAALLTNVFYFSVCIAAPHVELSITDINGTPLSTASVGIPFQVRVVVAEVDEKFSAPAINGLQHFVRGATSSSSYFTITNGKSSSQRTFSYVVRADHPGTFTLGPARIHNNSAVLESNVLKIEVSSLPQTTSTTIQDQPAVLKIEADKKSVVVGEPIVVTISLLHEPEARLASPLAFDVEQAGFKIGKQHQTTTRHVLVNGKTYASVEQKMELYAHEPGSHTIPVMGAQVQIPSKRHNSHPYFDFDDFFGRRVERYQLYSSPVSIEVLPLPDASEPAQAVGEFKHFSAHLGQQQAQLGEGTVFKLTLEGTGDEKKVQFPTLTMPTGLTSYESKSEVEEQGPAWKKTFEYIVQGIKKGNYEIPAQKFTFFDVKARKYKTLTTQPLTIAITAESYEPTVAEPSEEQPAQSIENKEEKEEQQPVPVQQRQPSFLDSLPSVSMKRIYDACLVLIVLSGGIPFVRRWYYGSPQKRACRRARRLLKQYKKQQDTTKLYQLMMNLLAEHAVSTMAMNEQGAYSYLQSKGIGQQDIDALTRDLNHLAEVSFSANSYENKQELFDRVQYWIGELEKLR